MSRGYIVKRGNSYRVHVSYQDEFGKRIQVTKTAPSSTKAEKLKTALLSEIDKGIYQKPTSETVASFMQSWIDDYKNLSAKSYDRYTGIVKNHITPSIGALHLTKLAPQHIQRLYADKLESGLAPRSVKYIHTVLHRGLQSALKWHKLTINPADSVDIPKAQQVNEMQIWNESEIVRFLKTARTTPYHCLFHLALFSGARRGELLALRWQDCDLVNGQMSINRTVQHVNGKYEFRPPKTAKSRRTIAIPQSSVLLLRQLRESTEHTRARMGQTVTDLDLIFTVTYDGFPLRPNTVSRAWEQTAGKANVKIIRFHDARHTHASILLKQGVPLKVISERLGHSSISVTADIYAHLIPGMQESAAKLFDAAISTKYNEMVTNDDKK